MSKIIERNVAELIMVGVISLILMTSCGSTKEIKECCKKTAQKVYEYEGLTIE